MEYLSINGRDFYNMVVNASNRLSEESEFVNALNVFPVPDGDTGTNMSMTFKAAVKEIENMNSTSIGEISKALAKGALMGARGNSGVILSQILRGISKGLSGLEEADAGQMIVALKEGSDSAYKAVMRPTEGTILSVIRATAEAGLASENTDIASLMDEVTKGFPKYEEEYFSDVLKFCLIGRPNVGKSSLTNALLNEDRVIVSNEAGTTRDSIDTKFKYEKKDYVVIDTAGMRKKGKIYENVEMYSLMRAMKAIERSDVCVIVINAEEGIIEHDKHIAAYALEAGKPMVLVVNKWDTVDDKNDIKSYTQKMRAEFQFLSYVPIVFLSALTKKRLHTLMPEIIKVYENSRREIKTSVLNDVINDAYALNPAPSYKGKRLKIYFSAQTGTMPPKFTLNVNNIQLYSLIAFIFIYFYNGKKGKNIKYFFYLYYPLHLLLLKGLSILS